MTSIGNGLAAKSSSGGLANTTLSNGVWLSNWISDLRNVCRLRRRSNAEHWRLPFLAFRGQLLIVGGFTRDTTRKFDVLKHGILLCNGDIDFLISNYPFRLLLTL